jgi:hypothetical protein
MAKRILIVALVAPLLALAKPAPAAAHVGFSVSIGLPFFGAAVGVPAPLYAPYVYTPYAYAPYGYGPPPVYAPVPVYGPRYFYGPRRVFVPAYGRYGNSAYYGQRFVGHRGRRW